MTRTLLLIVLLSAAGQAMAALPAFAQVKAAYRASDAQLLDRHGQPLQRLRIDKTVRRHAWVSLQEVSPAMTAAVLRAEDQRFYQHGGVDLEAVAKAAWDNLTRSRPRGASTISMQLAALLQPGLQGGSGGRSWRQKWDQASAARTLEAAWSKPQILEAYLNLVFFRGEKQGVGAAAQVLFGKAPSGINHLEATILAALIRAPNAAPAAVAQRACLLAAEAKLEPDCPMIRDATHTALSGSREPAQPLLAAELAQRLLKQPDQRLPTTLDARLQQFAVDSLRQQMLALRERNVKDGAALVIDNASGEILAWVGNTGNSEVDGVLALRQAGSTLKPFLYQLALERKLLTAASILDDSAIEISTPAGLYVPQNYERDFKGHVSLRSSLGNSLNVPAVRTLVLTGLDGFHQRLKDLGLSSLTESSEYYGYALALGSAEVRLLELTNAYRTLAAGGLAGPVTLAPGARSDKQRILDARAAFVVGDILADRAARSLTFGLKSELATNYWSAVKTGTSKDMRDNWCIGYSDKYTIGVWVGNFDGQPMWDVSGVSGAAPVWRDLMDYLHQHTPGLAPTRPAGLVTQGIEYRPPLEGARVEWFIAGTESRIIELLPASQQAGKIRYPGDGTIIVLDPDIPLAHQRVFFQAQGGGDLFWRLDAAEATAVNHSKSWTPVAGTHRLSLIDSEGKSIDEVVFSVRGMGK